MQQIRESPSVLPEIVWGALDWFLSYEIWIFDIDHFVYFWWRKWVYTRNILLKMFTFVRHYMNLIFSKVFVNIKTVLPNYCTQCLYWLNFFFWEYFHTYVGSGHFLFKIWISILVLVFGNMNNFWGFVDIFWGSSQNWTIFRGHFCAF